MYHPNSHFLNAVYFAADGGILLQPMHHSGMFDLICIIARFSLKSSARA
jgi:hypothetical protein